MNETACPALIVSYHRMDHEAGHAATLSLYCNSIKLHVGLSFKGNLFHFTAPPVICNDLTKAQLNTPSRFIGYTLQTLHRISSFDEFTVEKRNTLKNDLKWNLVNSTSELFSFC